MEELKKKIYDVLEKHRKLNGQESKTINDFQFYYIVDDLMKLFKENAKH